MCGWGGGGGGGGGPNLPRWSVMDTDMLTPLDDLENALEPDGYHVSEEALVFRVHAIFSELCPPFGAWSESLGVLASV